MISSSKTISEFQQEYTSVGADRVEAELRNILALLKELQTAQANIQMATIGSGGKSTDALNEAKAEMSSIKQAIGFRKERLATEQSIDRVEGDLARIHIERQALKSKADEQYEKDFQALVAEEQKIKEAALKEDQIIFNKRMQAESKAEVERIRLARERSKEYLEFQRQEREAYKNGVSLDAAKRAEEEKKINISARKIQSAKDALRASQFRTGDGLTDVGMDINQKLANPSVSAPTLQLSEGQKLQQGIEIRKKAIESLVQQERDTRVLLSKAIGEQNFSAMDRYKQKLTSLASGSRELGNQTRNMTKDLKEWEQQHTLMGWITNFWSKFQTVFVRVISALLSFEAIRIVTSLIGGFFKGIIDANAQLEVLDARLRLMTKDGGVFSALKQKIIDLTVTTPFIIKDFIDASVSLQAFGINSIKYLQPVADWATAIGRDLNDVSTAFAKVASGSPRTALLLTTRGISKADFDRELAATGDRLVALSNVIEKRFGGMSERVSQTFTGFLSNIRDAWFVLSAELGKDLFARLRQDTSIFFDTLKGNMQESGIIVKALSKTFGVLYDIIKVALGAGVVLLIMKLETAIVNLSNVVLDMLLVWRTAEASAFWEKHAILGKAVGILTNSYVQWAVVIAAVGVALVDIINKQKELNDSIANSDRVLNKSGEDSEAYINALEKRKEALKNRYSGTFYDIGRFFMLTVMSNVDAQIEAETNRLTELQDQAQRMLNLRMRENALLDEQLSLLDKINMKKEIEGKVGGNESRLLMLKEIEKTLSGGVSLGELPNRPMSEEGNKQFFQDLQFEAKKYGLELKAVNDQLDAANGLYKINKAYQVGTESFVMAPKQKAVDEDYAKKLLQVRGFLKETIKTQAQLEQEAMDSIPARVDEFIRSLKDSDNVQEKFTEWFKNLPDIVKDSMAKAGRAVKDYSDEIARIREELAHLNAGEDKITSRIAGERVRVDMLQKQKPIGIVVPDLTKLAEERLSPFETFFQKAAQATGVEVGILKAIAQQETARWESVKDITTAGSPKGARGIMQLLPGTFKEQKVGDDILNPEQNILAGATYFKKMLDKFKGDLRLALAAYNAGPGRVINAGMQIPDIEETKKYVKLISESLGISEEQATVIAGIEYKSKHELELLRAKLALKKDEISLDDLRQKHQEKMNELKVRELELTASMAEKQAELGKKNTEYQFALNPDADKLREDRLNDLKKLREEIDTKIQMARNAAEDAMNSIRGAMMTPDEIEANHLRELAAEQRIQAKQYEEQAIGLQSKILDVKKAMLDDPSTNLGEGIGKAIIKIRREMERFWDDMGEIIISSIKELSKSIVIDLVFGNSERDKFDKEISDAKLELQGLQEEKQRSFNNINQFRRNEGETNDEYLQRTQRLSEIQTQQADIYTFQTKELELLQKINDLEAQRSDIVINRLKAVGQKIFDKVLDQALNGVVSSVFGGLTNLFDQSSGDNSSPDTSFSGSVDRFGAAVDKFSMLGGGSGASEIGGIFGILNGLLFGGTKGDNGKNVEEGGDITRPSGGGGIKNPALANVAKINPILVEPSIQNIANRTISDNSVRNTVNNQNISSIINKTVQNTSNLVNRVVNQTLNTVSSAVRNEKIAYSYATQNSLDNRVFNSYQNSLTRNTSNRTVQNNNSAIQNIANRTFATTSSMVQNFANRVLNNANTVISKSNIDSRSFRNAIDNSSVKSVLTNTSLKTSLDNRSFREISDSRAFSNVRNTRNAFTSNINNSKQYNSQSKGDVIYTLHINGDVYGETDFTRKVDDAFQKIARQRTK